MPRWIDEYPDRLQLVCIFLRAHIPAYREVINESSAVKLGTQFTFNTARFTDALFSLPLVFSIFQEKRFTLLNSQLYIFTMGRTSTAKKQLLDAMVDLMWERSYGSLTIDVICEKADVKKGSFYYFFKSKLELAVAAMDHIWIDFQPVLDGVFSASRPPLERLALQMHECYTQTKEVAEKHGRVLGCPYYNVGTEVSTIEPELIGKVNQLLARLQRYFEAAITEAIANGDIAEIDAREAARIIFNLYEGMMAQARMKNDLAPLKDLPTATARILGIAQLPSVQEATRS